MKAFGIELRKSDTVSALYQDVDIILRDSGMKPGEIGREMQKQTVAHSLHKMLRADAYCSICTIKECAGVAQISISKERLDMYQAIHCVHWNEMLPSYRDAVIAAILDDFRSVLRGKVADEIIEQRKEKE